MRTAIAIIKKFGLEMLRDKATLLSMIAIPLLFTFVFGVVPGLTGTGVTVAIFDEGQTPVSQAYVRALQEQPQYHVLITRSRIDYMALIRNQQVSDVLILPKNFQSKALAGTTIPVQIVPSSNVGGATGNNQLTIANLTTLLQKWAIAGKLEESVAAFRGAAHGALTAAYLRGMRHAQQMPVLTEVRQRLVQLGNTLRSLTAGQRSVVGFATMFIVFSIFGQANSLFEEKRMGTWDRLKASGASKASIVGGYGTILFLVGWLQYLIVFLSGRYLFGISIPFNWLTILVVSLYCFAISGIALCVSGMVKTVQQLAVTGSFFAIVTSMIGGSYWPLSLEPKWMQHVAWFVPQSWAMQAFQMIVAGATGMHTLVWPIVVLCTFAVVFFLAGIAQLRYS
ncbi:MAG: ABC transporter permease [Bacilli bacterium]